MKIVRCTKGGRVPEGYCMESCLNYSGRRLKKKAVPRLGSSDLFANKNKGKSWIHIYAEDTLPRPKEAP